MTAGAEPLSRRALLGAGLARIREAGEPAPPAAPRAPRSFGEDDPGRLAGRLGPVAGHMLELAGPFPGRTLLVGSHSGPLAAAALRAGPWPVTCVSPDGRTLAAEAQSFDVVLAWFGLAHRSHPRAVSDELRRVLRPGGRLVMAAWSPAAARELRRGLPSRGHRIEHWSRYETAYRHFFAASHLDVVPGRLPGDEDGPTLEYALVVAAL